jgi:Rrf2 family iron-sulfur cluster assembly transcriptional regulator
MQLTTKGRYAVTAMLDLATNKSGKPTTLEIISERQNISLSYLEQLFSKLRKASLVKSVRGPGGGYLLVARSNIAVTAYLPLVVNCIIYSSMVTVYYYIVNQLI